MWPNSAHSAGSVLPAAPPPAAAAAAALLAATLISCSSSGQRVTRPATGRARGGRPRRRRSARDAARRGAAAACARLCRAATALRLQQLQQVLRARLTRPARQEVAAADERLEHARLAAALRAQRNHRRRAQPPVARRAQHVVQARDLRDDRVHRGRSPARAVSRWPAVEGIISSARVRTRETRRRPVRAMQRGRKALALDPPRLAIVRSIMRARTHGGFAELRRAAHNSFRRRAARHTKLRNALHSLARARARPPARPPARCECCRGFTSACLARARCSH